MDYYEILPVIFGLVFLGSFGISQNAFADEWTLNDSSSCNEILGFWTEPNNCTVLSSNLNVGDVLTISPGIVLSNHAYTFFNYGTINNYGTFENPHGFPTVNYGTISNFDTISNNYDISNIGEIKNNGTIENDGTIDNDGFFTNELVGTIKNNGTINNNSPHYINNKGTIENYDTINIIYLGTLNNPGIIVNKLFGIIYVDGTLYSYGTMENHGVLEISGIIATLVNDNGLINNNGAIVNVDGLISNSGTFTNTGTLSNTNTIDNNLSGTVSNNGIIINQDTFTNAGSIKNYCGILSGTIPSSGNNVAQEECIPQNIICGNGTTLNIANNECELDTPTKQVLAEVNTLLTTNNCSPIADSILNVLVCIDKLIGDSITEISIDDVSQLEGNSGTTLFDFAVTRSGNTDGVSSVDFSTSSGTAGSRDYSSKSGTVTFTAGETSQTVSIYVKTDKKAEEDETFNVNLTNPIGCSISDDLGIGTIINDD